MIIKQISIFVENRKGRLAELTGIIAENGINIRALSIADTTHFGVLRIIVDDPFAAERILRENNITVSMTSVISVNITDKPGGLYSVLKLLSDNDISVEYMYHAFIHPDENTACVVMRIEEDLKAQQLLEANGYSGPSYIN